MPRIAPIEAKEASGEKHAAFTDGLARFGRLTNMKRTLLHSVAAYKALMEWYTLFDAVKGFAGERLAIVFSHAISAETDCLICTTFMRRILVDWGENPDALSLDDKGEAMVAFGRALAREGNRVPNAVYRRIERFFNKEEIVALTAFGALMVATNIINNVLEVELDEYLYAYRKPEPPVAQG
jgi:alkylhydroperoxidase family enzyme